MIYSQYEAVHRPRGREARYAEDCCDYLERCTALPDTPDKLKKDLTNHIRQKYKMGPIAFAIFAALINVVVQKVVEWWFNRPH